MKSIKLVYTISNPMVYSTIFTNLMKMCKDQYPSYFDKGIIRVVQESDKVINLEVTNDQDAMEKFLSGSKDVRSKMSRMTLKALGVKIVLMIDGKEVK